MLRDRSEHLAEPADRAVVGGVIVGFVGSFASFHGIDLLKELATTVLGMRPDVRLLMTIVSPKSVRSAARILGKASSRLNTGVPSRLLWSAVHGV